MPEAGEQNPLLRMTAFYALESNHQTVLWDVRPDVVIMYDPDMACIRQLEVGGRVVGSWLHSGETLLGSSFGVSVGELARGRWECCFSVQELRCSFPLPGLNIACIGQTGVGDSWLLTGEVHAQLHPFKGVCLTAGYLGRCSCAGSACSGSCLNRTLMLDPSWLA